MRCFEAGGGAREFLRRRTIDWLDHALSSVDEVTCHSILRVLSLAPFHDAELIGDAGMGVVVELDEGSISFATLQPLTDHLMNPFLPDDDVEMRIESTLGHTARLAFADPSRDLDVSYTEFTLEIQRDPGPMLEVAFESVLLHALYKIAESGHTKFLVNNSAVLRRSEYPFEFPLHFLMQKKRMTSQVLRSLVTGAGAMALWQRDTADNYPFHYIKYRSRLEGEGEVVARNDGAIADLIVGVVEDVEKEIKAELVQVMLQQAAAHAFIAASRRLIEDHGGQIDEPSECVKRTPRMIGKDVHDTVTRALFYDHGEVQQRALEEQRRELSDQHQESQKSALEKGKRELVALFEQKDEEKRAALEKDRCTLFCETMMMNSSGALVPFSLGAGELQSWLRGVINDGKATPSLQELVDLMGDVDGMTVLHSWVVIGFISSGEVNHGKIAKQGVVQTLPNAKFKIAALVMLAGYLGLERLQYYKAILMSCEKRSLLTDLDHVKLVGQGAFGRFAISRRSAVISLLGH